MCGASKHRVLTFQERTFNPKDVCAIKDNTIDSVSFDFSKISFFHPNEVAFARALIELCFINNITMDFGGIHLEEHRTGPLFYANRMGLFRDTGIEYTFKRNISDKFTEVITIRDDDSSEIGQQVSDILHAIHLPTNFIVDFVDMFSELCNNVYYHSGPEINTGWGCVHAQTYSNRVELSVCDLGIGVYRSYQRTNQLKGRSESELLRDIFNLLDSSLNIGSGRDIRGRGLHEVQSFLENFGGTLTLRSGSHRVTINNGEKSVFSSRAPFYGTMIDIVVPVDE